MNSKLLEELSSPGLVRRAQKSLRKSSPTIHAEHFQFEQHHGTLDPTNPLHSDCDCNASGLCKHIIAAYLYTVEGESGASPNVSASVISMDLPTVLQQAGKVRVRQLWRQSLKRWSVTIEQQSNNISVIFDQPSGRQYSDISPSVHFQKACQFDDLITHNHSQPYALLALWLYCQQFPRPPDWPWPQWLLDEQQQQRQMLNKNRQELTRIVQSQLKGMVSLSIDLLRTTALLELQALITPLERAKSGAAQLKQLLALIEHYVEGQGIRNRRTVLVAMSAFLAEVEKVREPDTLEQVSDNLPTQLLCLAAYPWQSKSGAHGVSMILQDQQGHFFTLAESRRKRSQPLSYEHIWKSHSMLNGAPPGATWQGKTYAIDHAEINGWQRVRRLQKTVILPSNTEVSIHSVDCVHDIDWQQPFLCFKPQSISDQWFDEARQCYDLICLDRDDNSLCFSLEYSELNKAAIVNLDQQPPGTPELIIARIEQDSQHWRLHPCALYRDGWINLYFDTPSHHLDKTRFNQRLTQQPSALLGRRTSYMSSTLVEWLDHCINALADHPAKARVDLADQAAALGFFSLSQLLRSGDVLDSLRAAYCINHLLTLNKQKPVITNKDQT
jgi:hypothetical protein